MVYEKSVLQKVAIGKLATFLDAFQEKKHQNLYSYKIVSLKIGREGD